MSNFELGTKIKASLEAIKPQAGKLFEELTEEFDRIKQMSNVTSVELNQSQLNTIIRKHTHMAITFNLVEHSWIAAVLSDPVDKNHVLYEQRSKFVARQQDNYQTKSIEEIGYVDLQNSKVGGIFTEMSSTVYLGSFFFAPPVKNDLNNFSAREIAALVLHELGHAFSKFEFLGKTILTGLLISSTVKSVMDIPAGDARTKIVKNAVDKTAIDLSQDEVQKILEQHGANSDIVIMSESITRHKGLTKSQNYDARNFEQMADQFAVRHGAGPELAIALERYSKINLDINYLHPVTYAMFELLSILHVVVMLIGTIMFNPLLVIFLGIILLNLNTDKIYDDIKDRLIKIKQELISDLRTLDKNREGDKAIRENLINSIEIVELKIEEAKDRKQVLQALWDIATPWGRNKEQQERKQKLLEAAIDNELHLKSAQLYNL